MQVAKIKRLKWAVIGCSLLYGLTPVSAAYAENLTLQNTGIAEANNLAAVTDVPLSSQETRTRILASLPGDFTPVYLSQLVALYGQRGMQPMWQDTAAVSAFQQQLAEVAMAGIHPQFSRWAEQLTRTELQGEGRDILLSDAMLGYLDYLAGISTEGSSWLYGGSSYKPKAAPQGAINMWLAATDRGDAAPFVASLIPANPQYIALRQSLRKLIQPSKAWPMLKDRMTLRPGDISPDIPALREILARRNQSMTISPSADEGQIYTPDLVEKVKIFQRQQGLNPDGAIGPQTRSLLNATPEQRAAIVALNMQRLRLLPDKIDTGIMVNIPAFSLTYYRNGQEALQSRVIVGRPDRKTPLMSSALSNVVVNPPWNVPQSLAKNDLLPKIRRDPGYLERQGYSIYRGWSNDAQSVDPWMVDWSTINDRNLPFRFQQKPGQNNALGRYKFNMPSSDSIYLHDTPNHNLFSRDARALSSGCVRVNKASELAGMLLQNAGWDSARIANTIDRGNTTYIPVRQNVPVMLYYLTAFSQPNGHTAFRADIYNYDGAARVGATNVDRVRLLMQ